MKDKKHYSNGILVDAVDGTKIYMPIGQRFSLKDYVEGIDEEDDD